MSLVPDLFPSNNPLCLCLCLVPEKEGLAITNTRVGPLNPPRLHLTDIGVTMPLLLLNPSYSPHQQPKCASSQDVTPLHQEWFDIYKVAGACHLQIGARQSRQPTQTMTKSTRNKIPSNIFIIYQSQLIKVDILTCSS